MLTGVDSSDSFQIGLLSEDYGKHLLGVQDLLQKHSLVEADIAAMADRVKSVNNQAESFLQVDADDGMCAMTKMFIFRSINLVFTI